MDAGRADRAATGAYVPALDGLRAVAVFAVIAYHLDFGWAKGGYLGVDLFFVLSGYLITSLLLGEWGRSGGIGFKSFWARRAKRLLPALVLLLLVLAIYAALDGPGLDRSTLRPDALATLFYSANWHQVFANQSYFAQFGAPSPLRHTWSLAIEEQFYLLWPLLLMGLLVLARSSRRVLLIATVLLAAGSAVLMGLLYHPGVDPSRVYYGTDTRAFELLVGAALAVVLARRPPLRAPSRIVLQVAGAASMGALVYAMVAVGGPPGWLYQGGLFAATVLVAVVIASVVHGRSGPLGAVLSFRPLCWIGIISYGLYLWHWPVVVLATQATTGISGYPLKALQVGITLALATASYYIVEKPIRRASFSGWKRRSFAPVGVLATAAALLVVTGPGATAVSPAAEGATIDAGLKIHSEPGGAVVAQPDNASGPTASPAPGLSSVMVVGDSTSITLAEGLKGPAVSAGLAIHDQGELGCSIVTNYTAGNSTGIEEPTPPGALASRCEWQKMWPGEIDQWHPKVVFMLWGPLDTADHELNGKWLRIGTPEWTSYYDDQLTQMVKLLSSQGAQVVIGTVPQFHNKPTPTSPNPTFDDPRRLGMLNAELTKFANQHPTVDIFDLASFVQPGDFGDDGVHFTPQGSNRLSAFVNPALAELADPSPSVVPPPGLILNSASSAQMGPGAR